MRLSVFLLSIYLLFPTFSAWSWWGKKKDNPINDDERVYLNPADLAEIETLAHYGWTYYLRLDEKPEWSKIVNELLTAIQYNPTSELLRRELSLFPETYIDDQSFELMISRLTGIASENPQALELNLYAVSVLIQHQRFQVAEPILLNLIARYGLTHPVILKELAICYLSTNELSKAEKLFAKATLAENLGGNPEVEYMAALFYHSLSNTMGKNLNDRERKHFLKLAFNHAQRAATAYRKITTLDNPDEVISLLVFLIENNFTDQAIAVIEDLRIHGLGNPEMDVLLAESYESKNADKMALDIWRDLSSADPYNFYFHIRQGQLFKRIRRLKDAILAFESAYRLKPNPPLAFELANLYLDTKEPEKALKYNKLSPQDQDVTVIMQAYIYHELNRSEEALMMLNSLCNQKLSGGQQGFDDRFYLTVAAAYMHLKNREKTLELLEQGLAHFPDNAELNNFIGYYLANENMNLERAENHIQKALALHPYYPPYLDSLAWVYYRQRHFKKAAFYIERTIGLQEHHKIDGVILDHAGDIYYALNQVEKAIFFWREALKNNAENLDAIAAKIRAAGVIP